MGTNDALMFAIHAVYVIAAIIMIISSVYMSLYIEEEYSEGKLKMCVPLFMSLAAVVFIGTEYGIAIPTALIFICAILALISFGKILHKICGRKR